MRQAASFVCKIIWGLDNLLLFNREFTFLIVFSMFTDENEPSFDAGKLTQLSHGHHLSIHPKTLKCVCRAAAFDEVIA